MKEFTNKKIIGISSLLVVLIIAIIVIISKNSYAVGNGCTPISNFSDFRDSLINTAYAYYFHGSDFQYDNEKITAFRDDYSNVVTSSLYYPSYRMRRSTYLQRPEDGTSFERKYLVCGEFVNSVFYNTFTNSNGEHYLINDNNHVAWSVADIVNLADGTSDNGYADSGNITLYYEKITAAEANGEKLKEIKNIIRGKDDNGNSVEGGLTLYPGDVIAYKHGDSGAHVMLYVGRDFKGENNDTKYVLHSTGYTYNYSTKRDYFDSGGTVQLMTFEYALGTKMKLDNYDPDNYVKEVAVLRPWNSIKNNYCISEESQKRNEKPGLVRSKSVSVKKHESVNPGSKIKYTITLANASNETLTGINISDKIPNNTDFISCTNNCTYNSTTGEISWNNVEIAPAGSENGVLNVATVISSNSETSLGGESARSALGNDVSYSYTVKVKNNTPFGTKIVSDETYVDEIKLSKIEIVVNNTLTKTQRNYIKDNYETICSSSDDCSNTEKFINKIYKSIYNNETIKFYSGTENIFQKDYFSNEYQHVKQGGSNGYSYHLFSTSGIGRYANMYVDGLFGGYYALNKDFVSLNASNRITGLSSQIFIPNVFDGRELTYDEDTFMVGDVLALKDANYLSDTECEVGTYNNNGDGTCTESTYLNGDSSLYLYVGDGNFAAVNSSGELVILNAELTYKPNGVVKSTGRSRIIDSLMGQDAFVVLRPSQAITTIASNVILLTEKTITYSGTAVEATVTSSSGADVTLKYYKDSSCTTKTTTTNSGAASTNGVPVDVGTYYVTGTVPEQTGYYAGTLECTKALTINKKDIEVTWGDTTEFTYNGSSRGPSVTTPVNGATSETINLTRTTSVDVGSYTSTASCSSVTGGRAKCSNYNLVNNTKAYTISYKDYIITLDKNGGSGGTTTLYGRYAIGIYSDSNRTTPVTKITIPTKDGYIFEGYYGGSTMLIDSTGSLTSAFTNKKYSNDKTLTAKWTIEGLNITKYEIDGDYMLGIEPNTSISDFDLNISSEYVVKILDREDNIKTDGYIGTGYKIQIYLNDSLAAEYIAIIKGDINGDGSVNISDVAKLYRSLKGKVVLEDYEIKAGNIIDDNIIKINDITKLYRYVKGKINAL